MENDTESPREGTSSFIFVFLTLGDRTVYNIDSKQFYCDKSVFTGEKLDELKEILTAFSV